MKILLIQPPIPNFEEDPYPPLGLAYIAAVLEKKGYKVRIVDMPPLKLNIKELENYVKKYTPSVVGITCVAANYAYCIRISEIIKAILPKCIVIVGGPHVTFIPDITLKKFPSIDIVIRGEGEITMLEVVRTIERYGYDANRLRCVKGIHFKTDRGKIFHTMERDFIKDLDILPYPARHLLPMQVYKSLTKYTSIAASRGCPYNCIYCNASAFWKHKVRLRKPFEIIKEIEYIKNNFGFTHFKFIDDNFLFPSKWSEKLLNSLEKLNVKWICNARIDKINENIIRMASKAGCEKIVFGVETLSPVVQQIIKKNIKINRDNLLKIIKFCHNNGIKTKLNFIVGLPMQTYEDIKQIYDLLSTNFIDEVSINPLTPYPGTYIFNHFEELGLNIHDPNWWEKITETVAISTTHLKKKDINTSINLLRHHVVSQGIRSMEGY